MAMSVKYAPFESAIDLPFYYSLAAHKIDHDKLDDSPRRVLGRYVPRDGHRMQICGDALEAAEYASCGGESLWLLTEENVKCSKGLLSR